MIAVQPLAAQVGVAPACQALGVSRASFYRRQRSTPGHRQPRPTPARALCEAEREQILDVLAGPRFVDRAPAEVVATLLDEGHYLCSERTMYRILAADQPVRERRNQREHPQYTKPELVATAPNQTWSWDITKLLGPTKWTYFYLYVVLDIFSRYAVGWMVADRENSALAGRLIEETCHKQGVQPQVLTLHSDRGAPMTSKCTAQLLADLGVTRSLSRPQVSDDNPFSEAQFKTLKYHPGFPGRFHDITAAIAFCRTFFPWYNTEHRHGGIAMLNPGRRASQSNPERAGAARADPSSRLDPSSRTLRSRNPTTGSPSPSRLDQPTCDTHNRRNCSVNRNRHCLKVVDRFRLAGFYRYAISRGHAARSPLPAPGDEPRQPRSAPPYVYSRDELRRLFGAIDVSRQRPVQLDADTLRALLLLLYGAGLRFGEAQRLTLDDVDLRDAVLTIRDTKFYKTRFVPVGPQLADALKAYAAKRAECALPKGTASTFLANRDGTPLVKGTVRFVFARLLQTAGIHHNKDDGRQPPCFHSLRHTAAVNRLASWYRQGADVQRLLPALSTWLGHAHLDGTQVYLSMTPELLHEASVRFDSYVNGGDHE